MESLWRRFEPNAQALIDQFAVTLTTHSLEASIRLLILAVLDFYRRDRAILRELTTAASRRPALSASMRTANSRNVQRLAALIVAHGGEISHPRPSAAVSLSLVCVFACLREFALDNALFDHSAPLATETQATETQATETLATNTLVRELTRILISYLES